MNHLERILATKREEVDTLRRERDELRARARDRQPSRGFAHSLHAAVPGIIAEIKRASPSRGLIRADFDPVWLAGQYEQGGARAISVLTDQQYFQGHVDYLIAARTAVALPVLRKDFLIDPLQLLEAAAIDADAVLLIAEAMQSPRQAQDLCGLADELDMDVLFECHDLAVLQSVLPDDFPGLIGVNNRDLRTFDIDLQRAADARRALGRDLVCESGIESPSDIRWCLEQGLEQFLIGEALMRADSPSERLRELCDAHSN